MFYLYWLSGFWCGCYLACKYVLLLVQRRSRWPWSGVLALGWLMFITGFVTFLGVRNIDLHYNGGHLSRIATPLVAFAPLIWLLSFVIWYIEDEEAERDQKQDEAQEGGWPPPPAS